MDYRGWIVVEAEQDPKHCQSIRCNAHTMAVCNSAGLGGVNRDLRVDNQLRTTLGSKLRVGVLGMGFMGGTHTTWTRGKSVFN